MLSCSLPALTGYCQIKLPGIFGDHMVIQRSQPVPVWGWSSPNEKMIVHFNQQQKEAIADQNGKWRLNLDPEPAGGPFELNVQGKNSIDHSRCAGGRSLALFRSVKYGISIKICERCRC